MTKNLYTSVCVLSSSSCPGCGRLLLHRAKSRACGSTIRLSRKRFSAWRSTDGRMRAPQPQAIINAMTPRFPVLLLALLSAAAAQDWPSFRGPAASGVADHQNLPVKWDAAHGSEIRWSTALPGLAHSSPIVWDDQIFVTTAVSTGRPDASFKRGLYGEGDASDDVSPQQWKLICLDRKSGQIAWDRTAGWTCMNISPPSRGHFRTSRRFARRCWAATT